MSVLLALISGLLAGLCLKGININITHKHEQPEQPKEEPKYNESMAGYLDPQVMEYYAKTQGKNKW